LATTFDFTSFLIMAFLEAAQFLQLGYFGLNFIIACCKAGLFLACLFLYYEQQCEVLTITL